MLKIGNDLPRYERSYAGILIVDYSFPALLNRVWIKFGWILEIEISVPRDPYILAYSWRTRRNHVGPSIHFIALTLISVELLAIVVLVPYFRKSNKFQGRWPINGTAQYYGCYKIGLFPVLLISPVIPEPHRYAIVLTSHVAELERLKDRVFAPWTELP
jgi:hypothetical protein